MPNPPPRLPEVEFLSLAQETLRLCAFPGSESDPEPRALIREAMRARGHELDLEAQLDKISDQLLSVFMGGVASPTE